ncbi:MAG: hypothetical protein NTU89_01980 [Candidatus Dependentiae bacterium]|nr:hypothetical protein [Candidatus Dependentiae bacterium]
MKNYKKIYFALLFCFISHSGLFSSNQAISFDTQQDFLLQVLHDEILQDCKNKGEDFSESVFCDAAILMSNLFLEQVKNNPSFNMKDYNAFLARGVVDYYRKEIARTERLLKIYITLSEGEIIEIQRQMAEDLKQTDIKNMIDVNGCCLKQEFYEKRLGREIIVIALVSKRKVGALSANQFVEAATSVEVGKEVHPALAQASKAKVRRLTECPAWVSATRSDLIKKAKSGGYDFDIDVFKSIVIAIEAAFNLVYADLKNNKNKQEIVNCIISQSYSIVCGERRQCSINEDACSKNPSDYIKILQKESVILAKKALKNMPDSVISSLVNPGSKSFNGHEWDRYMFSYEEEFKNAVEAERNRIKFINSKKTVEKSQVEPAQLSSMTSVTGSKDKEVTVACKEILNTASHVLLDAEGPILSPILKVLPPKAEEPDWIKANRLYAEFIADQLKQQSKNKNMFKQAKGLSKTQQLKFLYKKESDDALKARQKEDFEIQKLEADRLQEEKRIQRSLEQAEFDRKNLEREKEEKKAIRIQARLKLPELEEKSCRVGCLLVAGSALKSWIMYAFLKKEKTLQKLSCQKAELEKELEEKNERFKAFQEAMPPVRIVGEDKYKPWLSCFLYRKEIDPSCYTWNPYDKTSSIKPGTNLFRKNADIYRVENPEIGDIEENIKLLQQFISKKDNVASGQVGVESSFDGQRLLEGLDETLTSRPRLMVRGRGRS